jgi:hypothetical protein
LKNKAMLAPVDRASVRGENGTEPKIGWVQ